MFFQSIFIILYRKDRIFLMASKKSTTQNTNRKKKKVALALQGGGSHGAYTWGVVDSLLEHGGFEIEGVSGTSAGGMNATAIVNGLIQGGEKGARDMMAEFWNSIGKVPGVLQFSPYAKHMHSFKASNSVVFKMINYMKSVLSPYQFNPQNIHPLKEVVENIFNFDLIQNSDKCKLFLAATRVAAGKLRIFQNHEINSNVLLASACIPQLFQAVDVDGEYYWDGGYTGNPAIYPLIYNCDTPDIIVVQIRNIYDPKIPTTVEEIEARFAIITENNCLLREMRSISFITKLIDQGIVKEGALKKLHMHVIRDDQFFAGIEKFTSVYTDPDFLQYLFEHGKRLGKRWIKDHYDDIGKKSTADIDHDYVDN